MKELKEMKNLFEYASRELSQDAFLRWLFENYRCKNPKVCEVSAWFLKNFADIDTGEIQELKTCAQWGKIDVVVFITMKNNRKIAIAIEDKVQSKEHEQLATYSKRLLAKNYDEIKGVFYKTFPIDTEERCRVESETEITWKIYDLEGIKELLSPFKKTGCEILDNYISHIIRLSACIRNKNLLDTDESIYDTYSWYGFYSWIAEKYKDRYQAIIEKSEYRYVYIAFRPKGRCRGPYLEVRSRDCVRNKNEDNKDQIDRYHFKAAILTYGKEWEEPKVNYPERIQELCENIKTLISDKKLKILTNSSPRKNPKQIVCTNKELCISGEKDFFSNLDKCLSDYDVIMRKWEWL